MNIKNSVGIGCFVFFLLYFYLLIAHFETTFLVTVVIILLLYILRKQLAVWANLLAVKFMERKMKKMMSDAMKGEGMNDAMNDMMNMLNNMRNQQTGNTSTGGSTLLHDTTAFLAKRGFNIKERKEEGTKHPTYIYERARTDYNISVSIDIDGRDVTYSLSSIPSGKAPFSDVISDTEEDIIAELRSAL